MLSRTFWVAAGGALIGSFQMGLQLAIMNCSMAAVAQSLRRPDAAGGALIVRLETILVSLFDCHYGTNTSRAVQIYVFVHATWRRSACKQHWHLAMQVSSLLLGACIGALSAGRCADVMGPRTMLLTSNVFLISGAIMSATAPTLTQYLAGKSPITRQCRCPAERACHSPRTMPPQVVCYVACKSGLSRWACLVSWQR